MIEGDNGRKANFRMQSCRLRPSSLLSAVAGLAFVPMFTDRFPCYGWGAGDGCLRVANETTMSFLALAIIAAGLFTLIPRTRLPASIGQPFLVLAMIILGARKVGSGLSRHDVPPTEGWSLANAFAYADIRVLVLVVVALALSVTAALLAWRRRHS